MVIAGGDREWNLVSEVEVKGIWSLWLMSLVSMEAIKSIKCSMSHSSKRVGSSFNPAEGWLTRGVW